MLKNNIAQDTFVDKCDMVNIFNSLTIWANLLSHSL